MRQGGTLEEQLREDGVSAALNLAIVRMAEAARSLADLIGAPAVSGRLGAAAGGANIDGDQQRKLDLVAEDLFSRALFEAGVGAYLSEEVEEASLLDPAGTLAVAIDPLDGSSNIDVNAPVGAIFSILPMTPEAIAEPAHAFRQNGRRQLAAGFFVFGPQTSLVLSTGRGVRILALDRRSGVFVVTDPAATIPPAASEYAINASNRRHWRAPVRAYVEDCEQGAEGPTGRNFNMRWAGSLVADAYRIFTRGGIFLYPGDDRPGYDQGRLRLMYEANPVAFLAEQAGGAAIDGLGPVLDRRPERPHERTPLIMGSAEEVERVRRRHLEATPD